MKFVSLLALTVPVLALGQSAGTINTYAGGGPNNVPATSGNLPESVNTAVDSSGNYYVVGYYARIYEVNSSGTLTVVAGNGFNGYAGDGGPAPQAELSEPQAVAIDNSGNVYIADSYNCVVRKVTQSTGIISTFAGTPTKCGYSGNGLAATSAKLYYPTGVALDGSGNLYIADSANNVVREVIAATGKITNFAGNATYGYSGDGGSATGAQLARPYSVAVDGSGNVYIADADNYRIREVSGGTISTFAGNGTEGFSGDGGPAGNAEIDYVTGIAADSNGNVFIADQYNCVVREVSNGNINTVAGGGGSCGYSGNGNAATNAELSYPAGVAVDSTDNMYIADNGNNVIRQAALSGNIATIAGNGTFNYAAGVTSTGATLYQPSAAVPDTFGNIYIADAYNCVVRQVNSAGNISTFAGTPPSGTSSTANCSYSGDGGAATSAQLSYPAKAVSDSSGNVYIADTDNCVIRKVNTSGVITTFAGNGTCAYAGDGGSPTNASLSKPYGLTLDHSGNLYIADTDNQVIREVAAGGGTITTIAGTGGKAGYSGDGAAATSAELNYPYDVTVDSSGTLYIADNSNNRIRIVSSGVINTFAGNGGAGYAGDGGSAKSAEIYDPLSVAVDVAGDVLIADDINNRVRWVNGDGTIWTIAGNGTHGYSGDGGLGTAAELAYPSGVSFDSSGNIYIADSGNGRIRGITAIPNAIASTHALTFNAQAIGTTSASQTVSIRIANTPVTINSISITGDFNEADNCPSQLTSGTKCNINVTFTPTAAGTRTGSLTINTNSFFNPTITVALTGTAQGLAYTPTILQFGDQAVGTTSAAATVTFTNDNTHSITFSGASTNNTRYAVANNTCTGTLASGATCSIGVTFSPTATGTVNATLTVQDSDSTGPQLIPLRGTGVGTSISPTSLAFGSLADGNSSTLATTLTDDAGASLTGISASITGSGDFTFTTTCGSTLATTGSCSFSVTFQPTGSGAESATLTITDNEGTFAVTLTGTAQATSISPTSLIYGTIADGSSSALTTTVSNKGAATLSSISASLTGTNASDFSFTTTCGATLSHGSSCGYTVTFTPTGSTVESATLNVTDNENTYSVSLSGTAQATSLSPTFLTYGAVADGNTTTLSTTLTNKGSASLSGIGAAVSGANASDFTFTTTCGATLAANGTCSFTVTFAPTSSGTESATLSVTDNESTYPVALAGTAQATNVSPNKLAYGTVTAGTSTTLSMTLANKGSTALNSISASVSGSNAGDFSPTTTCGTSLPAHSSCTYTVTFTPTTTNAESASLNIKDSEGAFPVALSGTGQAQETSLSPTSLAYGTVADGSTQALTVTLTNKGTTTLTSIAASITGANAGEFSEKTTCGATLAGGGNCGFTVTFSPNASGPQTATLNVTDNEGTFPVSLGGTAQATNVSPTSLPYGTVTDGLSKALSVTLTNNGTAALTSIAASVTGANAGAFTEATTCGTSLAGGGACSFTVTFSPTVSGAQTATLHITDSEGTFPVALSGTGQAQETSLSSTSLAYGTVADGSSEALTVTLTNKGSTTLTSVAASITGANGGEFSETATCGATLAGGGSCGFTVTFSPNGSGAQTATLNVTDNEGTFPISLGGTAQATNVSPTSLAYGTLADGSTKALSVTLTNKGSTTLTAISTSITGTNAGAFSDTTTCGTTLSGGGTCGFTVTFSPTASGAQTATLNITDSEGTFPISVSGTAQATNVSPTSLAYGTVADGSTKALSVTLTNKGTATLTSISAGIAGANTGEFSETTTCGTSLSGGGSCSLTVTFSPKASGAQTATLNITDNEGTFPVALSGTAQATAISTTSLAFGTVVDGTTQALNVTLTNKGTGSLTSISAGVSGANPSNFGESTTCAATIPTGASCSFNVTFKPSGSGSESAILNITDAEGTFPVALSGTARATSLSPTSLVFNAVIDGSTQTLTTTMSNKGTASLTSITATITGTNASSFTKTTTCTATLAAGASCIYSVTFKPGGSGAASATLSIVDSEGTFPVALSGDAQATSISPSPLAFGTVVDGVSKALTTTLTNKGTAALTSISASVTGTNAANFVETTTCGTTLAAGASCVYTVTYKPTGSGAQTATLNVKDNEGTFPVALSGSAQASSISPASLAFGSVARGSTELLNTVLTNKGTASLTLSTASITGTNAANFTFTTTCGSTLGVGSSCSYTVTFKPTTSASESATLNIKDNEGTFPVALAGTGH